MELGASADGCFSYGDVSAVAEAACRQIYPDYYPKIITARRQFENVLVPYEWSKRRFFSLRLGYGAYQLQERSTNKFAVQAVSPVVPDTGVSTRSFEDFTVTTCYTDEEYDLKIRAEVSGTKTQDIFDDVFSKMVADAQPIPGFRRVKGGIPPQKSN